MFPSFPIANCPLDPYNTDLMPTCNYSCRKNLWILLLLKWTYWFTLSPLLISTLTQTHADYIVNKLEQGNDCLLGRWPYLQMLKNYRKVNVWDLKV